MTAGTVVFLLSLLLGIQPVTTDLYLPALPALTSGFGAKLSQAQLTLTGMLLAFGCSQMVWGPLSDRIGRRPVLLAGLGLYAVAGVGALLAGSMDWLILWRVLQGAAMGAAVMAGRAIVRAARRCPQALPPTIYGAPISKVSSSSAMGDTVIR